MIKRSNDFRVDHLPNLKGGDRFTKVVNFFDESDFNGMGRLFGISIIEPGGSIGKHTHVGEQEAYYILDGVATYNDNGTEVKLYPGQMSICRAGEFHAIRNDGIVDLRYIALISYTE